MFKTKRAMLSFKTSYGSFVQDGHCLYHEILNFVPAQLRHVEVENCSNRSPLSWPKGPAPGYLSDCAIRFLQASKSNVSMEELKPSNLPAANASATRPFPFSAKADLIELPAIACRIVLAKS